jgi:hypothetical protein
MSGTHFKGQVFSQGMPLSGGGMPAINGKWFYVNYSTGGYGNSGRDLDHPVKTLSKAYALCTTAKGDGICVVSTDTGTSSSTTVYESEAITWDKCGITVWGMCAPVRFGHRARISNVSTVLTLASLITVSGSNNAFYNLEIANWGTDNASLTALTVSGNRNYFNNCNIVKGGAWAVAFSDCTVSGSGNTFEDCVFGTQTVARTSNTVACNILFDGNTVNDASENFFLRCTTLQYASDTAKGVVKGADAAALVGSNIFLDCMFTAAGGGSTPATWWVGTTPTSPNGFVWVQNSGLFNIAAWSGNIDRVYVMGPPTTASAAIGVASSV